MTNQITITENNGKQAVSARELYEFLGITERFNSWCNRMFDYGFEENKDYVGCKVFHTQAKQEIQDYTLTLDTAKEISMIQRTEKGKLARQYFIACENKLKESEKPMSTLDIMEMNIKRLREQEQRINEVEQKVAYIEAKTTTRPDYFTIVGYATYQGIKVGLQLASKLGLKASRICKDKGFPTDDVSDPRFGKVKSYPLEVLQEVFEESVS